jgi:hypothetical protein
MLPWKCKIYSTYIYIYSFRNVIAVNVAANNIQGVAMEMQGWVPLALLSSYRIFPITFNNNVTHYKCVSLLLPLLPVTNIEYFLCSIT